MARRAAVPAAAPARRHLAPHLRRNQAALHKAQALPALAAPQPRRNQRPNRCLPVSSPPPAQCATTAGASGRANARSRFTAASGGAVASRSSASMPWATLAAGALLLSGRHQPVYQLGSADVNPMELGRLVPLLEDEARRRANGANGVPPRWIEPSRKLRLLTAAEAETRRKQFQRKVQRAQTKKSIPSATLTTRDPSATRPVQRPGPRAEKTGRPASQAPTLATSTQPRLQPPK